MMQRLFLHLRLLIILIFGSPFISLDLDLSVWMTSKWTNEMRGHLNSLWRLDCLPKFKAIAQEQGHISISEGFWEEILKLKIIGLVIMTNMEKLSCSLVVIIDNPLVMILMMEKLQQRDIKRDLLRVVTKRSYDHSLLGYWNNQVHET